MKDALIGIAAVLMVGLMWTDDDSYLGFVALICVIGFLFSLGRSAARRSSEQERTGPASN